MQSNSLPSASSYTSANSHSSPSLPNQTPKSTVSSDALSGVQTVSESPMPKTAGSSSIQSLNTPSTNAPVLRTYMGGYTLEDRPLSQTYSPEARGLAWEASTPGPFRSFYVRG